MRAIADVCRSPVGGALDDLLEGLQRFGGIEGLEKELAPGGFDGGIPAAGSDSIQGVRVLHAPERLRGTRGTEHRLGVGALETSLEDTVEMLGGGIAAPELMLQ